MNFISGCSVVDGVAVDGLKLDSFPKTVQRFVCAATVDSAPQSDIITYNYNKNKNIVNRHVE